MEIMLVKDPKTLEKVFALRHEVFVVEQGVSVEEERDLEDASAFHAAVLEEGEVVATGRLVVHESKGKIGRMAVKKGRRNQGLGNKVLRKLIEAGKENGIRDFYLHAQLYVKDFYLKEGFIPSGEVFEEAGIPHILMQMNL